MNRPPGQAERGVLRRLLRGVAILVCALLLAVVLGLGALAWRLDQGPLQIPYVAGRLATALSGEGVTVRVGRAALAWAGYKKGGGAPLYLQLGDVTSSNAAGVVLSQVPQARLLFPVRAVFGLAAPVDVAAAGARIAGSDAAVGIAALLHFGYGFGLNGADVTVMLGRGSVGPPGAQVAITGGGFRVNFKNADAVLRDGRLSLTPHGGSAPIVRFSGTAHQSKDWRGTLLVTADAVQAADLPAYWPPGAGGSARRWVTRNITAGVARDAAFSFIFTAPADLARFDLAGVTGGFDGVGLTLRWLPAAPPITALNGHFQMLDQDTILIDRAAGRLGKLAVSDGSMKITGVNAANQIGTVKLQAAGKLADAIAVLNAPPLDLLAQAPAPILQATGGVRINVAVTLPLDDKVKLAEVKLAVDAQLDDVAAPTPLAGLAFSKGMLALRADSRRLTVDGDGLLAGEVSRLAALVVFGQAPALRHFELKTVLAAAALRSLGLTDETVATDAVGGSVPLDVRLDATPKGAQNLAADADLTPAKLGVPVLGWAKLAGQKGAFHAHAVIGADGTLVVQNVVVLGPALDVEGTLRGRDLHLAPLTIGRTLAAGDVVFPDTPKAPYLVDLAGASLDLRAILAAPSKAAAAADARQPPPGTAPTAGPAWRAKLRFGSLYLDKPPAPALRDLVLDGAGRGGNVTTLTANAMSASGQRSKLLIRPVAGTARRSLTLDSGDGGNLLRVLGAYDDLRGGVLSVGAVYGGGAPFAGTVTIDRFQLLQAPAAAKILQALTIYGVPEAATGPGLVFSKLVAPFSVAHGVLTLDDARAYSASLGFTASGTVALGDGAANLDATVIPAYALNALPGKIPIIGKLFTAEKGGGVFAMRVKIAGSLAAPKVSANPLSALAPGALRRVFSGGK